MSVRPLIWPNKRLTRRKFDHSRRLLVFHIFSAFFREKRDNTPGANVKLLDLIRDSILKFRVGNELPEADHCYNEQCFRA